MPLIDHIPATLSPTEAVRLLRLDRQGGGPAEADALLTEAGPLMRPRAYYREAFIETRTDDSVTIDGRAFRSRVLRTNLEQAFKVFPYVLTVGPELETYASRLGDPLRRYYFEAIADATLDAAAGHVRELVTRESGFALLSSMNPGSLEDWPITEQAPLFDLLSEGPAATGVRLSESMMMIPRKSISGIWFPSEESFYSCQLCSREKCPGRKTAFDPKSWAGK